MRDLEETESSVTPLTISTIRPRVSKPVEGLYSHCEPAESSTAATPRASRARRATRRPAGWPAARTRRPGLRRPLRAPTCASADPGFVISRAAAPVAARRRPQSLGRFHTATLGPVKLGHELRDRIAQHELSLFQQHQDRDGGHRLGHRREPEQRLFSTSLLRLDVGMPCASKCTTLPCGATSVTAPRNRGRRCGPGSSGWMRFNRSDDMPTSSPFDSAGAAPIPNAASRRHHGGREQ